MQASGQKDGTRTATRRGFGDGELRDMAVAGRTPQQSYDGIAWLYGGP